jgi:uncharacterized protein
MVIGRIEEQKEMNQLLETQNADLLMVTGRRRVGKTFLVNEVYKENIVFKFIGTQYASRKNQLIKFTEKLQEFGGENFINEKPQNWGDAFVQLKKYLLSLRKTKRKRVVFFDEFPWIDHQHSGFLEEFSYWWNDWASNQNILVVISGSATSWMVRKIIQNRGGLHNRVTRRIHLEPFTLSETKSYIKTINKGVSDYDILQIYMCMGGVPLYLSQLKSGESAAQAIHRICFSKSGLLRTEFNDVYASLFDSHHNHVSVVKALAKKWSGLTRSEIAKMSKLTDGGGLNRILEDLEESSFIVKIQPIFNQKKEVIYRLADEYSRFYLHFIEGNKYGQIENWLKFQTSSKIYKAWQGYAFETICIKHTNTIKKCLQIGGVLSTTNSFYKKGDNNEEGFQIDMLINRADNAINLCEIKFYEDVIQYNEKLAQSLRTKRSRFRELSKTKSSIFNTLITTFGINKNEFNDSEIDNVIDMKCLFE